MRDSRHSTRCVSVFGVVVQGADPLIDMLFGLFLGVTVSLLQLADELGALAADVSNVIICELRPLGLNFALDLDYLFVIVLFPGLLVTICFFVGG